MPIFDSGCCSGRYYFAVNFVEYGFIGSINDMIDTKHVFISYSRRDGEPHALLLETRLHGTGLETWRDVRGIDPNKDFSAEIETAIEDASHVLVCITPDSKRSDSYVRREIGYALAIGKPVIPLRFVEITPHFPIVNFEWIEFFRDWEVAFTRLCSILRGEAREFRQQKPSGDPFQAYLETLYKRIVRFLDQAVIKLIDLTPEDTPDAVNTSSGRKSMMDLFFEAQGIGEENVTEPKPFHTFAEAFEYYEGRVLLLGEPGAGKTITLFAFVRDAVARRLNDVTAPLPLLGLISSWDAEQQTPLAEWLAKGYRELDKEKVEVQISNGKTFLLLDGLDELGGEQDLNLFTKEQFASYKNGIYKIKPHFTDIVIEYLPVSSESESTFSVRFDPRKRFIAQISVINQIIVSCRIKDYEAIGQKIALEGAVTLRPLNEMQMKLYLDEQSELWMAIKTDDALQEMLQTPLLLSFFAFAYKGMSIQERQELSNLSNSSGTLRYKIFEHYVRERFRHEERKMERKLFYDYLTAHRVLGQVAMENSTSFWRENQILREEIREALGDEPTEFIQQCQQLHLLVNVNEHTLRFMHLRLRDYFAIKPLIATLKASNWQMRLTAVQALGRIGDAQAVDPLIITLRDPDTEVRRKAVEALGRIGLPAVDSLIGSLRDPDVFVRRRVVGILQRVADARAIEPLIVKLKDPDAEVRRGATEALGRIADARAIEPLIAKLKDPDATVRYSAVKALEWIGLPAVEPLIASLRDPDTEVRRGATEVLGRITDVRAVEPLITLLRDLDSEVRSSAVEVLWRIGLPAVEPLITLLRDLDSEVRSRAVGVLGGIGDVQAVEPLIALLMDPDMHVRSRALGVLEGIGLPAVESLIAKLIAPDVEVRYSALEALRQIGTPEALEAVQKWREEEDKKQ